MKIIRDTLELALDALEHQPVAARSYIHEAIELLGAQERLADAAAARHLLVIRAAKHVIDARIRICYE